MVFPISDDNSDRRIVPVVNYVLIAVNVFVFVVFQGMGANDTLTYKLATVPAEIRTGKDIVTEDRVVIDPVSGQQICCTRTATNSLVGLPDAADFHVHARRHRSPPGKHVVPLDLRRQRGRSDGSRPVPGLLPADRNHRLVEPCGHESERPE